MMALSPKRSTLGRKGMNKLRYLPFVIVPLTFYMAYRGDCGVGNVMLMFYFLLCFGSLIRAHTVITVSSISPAIDQSRNLQAKYAKEIEWCRKNGPTIVFQRSMLVIDVIASVGSAYHGWAVSTVVCVATMIFRIAYLSARKEADSNVRLLQAYTEAYCDVERRAANPRKPAW